jgi:MFS family permease
MTSQQVIRSYLIIAGLHTLASSLIWGVNTLFLLGAGLTIGEVFIANAFFTVGMVVFEIPTGVLADTSGRRVSFLLSAVVLFLATIGYVWVSSVGGGVVEFSLMSIFLGLGFTFYSGAVEAWLVDALTETDYEGELDHVFARGAMITGFAMLIGTVGGGVLGTFDLSLPYIVRAALLVLVFVVAFFTMHDLGYQPRTLQLSAIPKEMRQLAQASVRFGWQEPQLRLIMIAGFIQSGFLMWAFYAWQPYMLELLGDPDAIWVAGIVSALISIVTIAGNALVDRITRYCGKRTTLFLPGFAVFALAMIGVGLSSSFWIALISFLIAIGAVGVTQPVRQSYIHHVVSSGQRATVISVDSMFGSAGGILSQTGLGQLSQYAGIAPGYIVGGAVSLLCIPLMFLLRGQDSESDLIVGTARREGACAGQGLPEIAHVDTKVRREPATPGEG